jgi:hypothetical protein
MSLAFVRIVLVPLCRWNIAITLTAARRYNRLVRQSGCLSNKPRNFSPTNRLAGCEIAVFLAEVVRKLKVPNNFNPFFFTPRKESIAETIADRQKEVIT